MVSYSPTLVKPSLGGNPPFNSVHSGVGLLFIYRRSSKHLHWKSHCAQLVITSSALCVHAQSHLTLCDPMDCSLPGSSVHGSFQARILEWVAISYSKGSSWPKDRTHVSCISCTGRQVLYHCSTWAPIWSPGWRRPLQTFYWIIYIKNIKSKMKMLYFAYKKEVHKMLGKAHLVS